MTLFFESSAGKLKIIENGVAVDYSEEQATEILSQPEVTVTADIGEITSFAPVLSATFKSVCC